MTLRHLLSRPSPVLFMCLFASQAGLLVLSPILPDLARHFDMSTGAVGQLRTISGAAGGVTALVVALAARRPPLRALLERGAVAIIAASALSAAAPSFAVL